MTQHAPARQDRDGNARADRFTDGLTDGFTRSLAATLRATLRPAALFLGVATVVAGTFAAVGPAPALPVGEPGAIASALAARDAIPDTVLDAPADPAGLGGLMFDVVDADADGAIGPDEFALWFEADDPSVDPFGLFDMDGDGRIDAREWRALAFEPLP